MAPPAERATECSEEEQDEAEYQGDDAEGPDDGNARQEPDDQQDDAESDHALSVPRRGENKPIRAGRTARLAPVLGARFDRKQASVRI